GRLGDLLQGRGRERAQEEPLVEAAEEARDHLAGDARVAHQGAHASEPSTASDGGASAGVERALRPGHDAGVAAPSPSPRPHRAIPSVERLLRAAEATPLLARWRRDKVVETVRLVLRELRHELDAGAAVPGDDALIHRVAARLDADATPRLGRVVNATGVVLH